MDILNQDQIIALFDQCDVSVAVMDNDMKIIYCNQAAQKFYSKVFGEREYLGYSTKNCHSKVNQDNINALSLMFAMGKPLNFYHAKFPCVKGEDTTIMQFPYKVDGKIEGMIEICIESSLAPGGVGENHPVFDKKKT